MWCSLNSRIARRSLCLSLAAWPLVGLAREHAHAVQDPQTPAGPLARLQRWGSGEFRRFGFLIYEATLWAGETDPLRPPLALQLTYRRAIAGKAIAAASIEQMRRFGPGESQLARWGERLTGLFPDVKPGDRILGQQLPDQARFFHNERLLGAVESDEFAAAFFAIWLDARTSEPALRAALLARPGG